MESRSGGDHVLSGDPVAVAGEIAHPPPRLFRQNRTRRRVPGVQAELPEAVETPGGDVGEVESGRPVPAHALHGGQEPPQHG